MIIEANVCSRMQKKPADQIEWQQTGEQITFDLDKVHWLMSIKEHPELVVGFTGYVPPFCIDIPYQILSSAWRAQQDEGNRTHQGGNQTATDVRDTRVEEQYGDGKNRKLDGEAGTKGKP